jgi:hypothetical protein
MVVQSNIVATELYIDGTDIGASTVVVHLQNRGMVSLWCSLIIKYHSLDLNQMWILKNSKELLANLRTQNFSQINSIKTYDFSTLYTTIPHYKLKSRLLDIIDNCFFNKNGKRKYSYLVISHQKITLLNITLIPRTSTPKLKSKRCWNSL